jgi:hypothetical protein
MHFARVARTTQIVGASRSLRRRHGYQCPICGGRVSLRWGNLRDPYFAHLPNEGSLECEEYHPAFGSSSSTIHVNRARPEVEDSVDEAGLCLDDLGEQWTLYLRLPEIPNDELGTVSLSSLGSAHVEVCAGNAPPKPISAFELRPGVGTARVCVLPTSDEYVIAPRGRWPAGVNKDPWQLTSEGLTRVGTLFRYNGGEWVRLRHGSLVEWGENLRVIAHSSARPPQACSPTSVRSTLINKSPWMLWRVGLPRDYDAASSRWLENLGHPVSSPASRVKILSIPDTFDQETRLPLFAHGVPIVAKVITPYAGTKTLLTLSFESNQISVPVHSVHDSRDVFFEVSGAKTGEYALEVDDEYQMTAEFIYVEPTCIEDLHQSLSQLPRLSLSIGESRFEAWRDYNSTVATNVLKTTPDVSIDLGVEKALIDLSFVSDEERMVRQRLQPREAERLIKELLSKQRIGDLTIEAGALGSLNLGFTVVEKEQYLWRKSRLAPWLACVSAAGPSEQIPGVNPATFRGFAGDTRLVFASMRSVSPAMAAQLRSLARKRGRNYRKGKR